MNDIKRERPPVHANTGQPNSHRPNSRRENLRSVASTIAILLIAPIVAVLLTAFVFQSYQVDGPSMKETLHPNDRLIIWKLPRTWAKITGNAYIPKRGDVVVFTERSLAQFNQDPGKQLIKRVIALPGERVTIQSGTVKVYNAEHPEGMQPDTQLPYGKNISTSTPIEGEWTVGEGQVFVIGDNRTNSLDSRTFGPIKASDIVGKLSMRVLPLDQIKKF